MKDAEWIVRGNVVLTFPMLTLIADDASATTCTGTSIPVASGLLVLFGPLAAAS
jgi:hypothetical protein